MLDETQKREFDIHAERMIRWLRANGHPHMSIVVDQTHAELLEGQMAVSVPWNKAAEGVGALAQQSQETSPGRCRPGEATRDDMKEAEYFSAMVRAAKMDRPPSAVGQSIEQHPLYSQYWLAIHQAMYGKGVRHGGAVTPFMDQPWIHYARMHGIGFLTGQAAKKLEEAASTKSGAAFVDEIRGAMVYLGMALIYHEEVEVKKLEANMQKEGGYGNQV